MIQRTVRQHFSVFRKCYEVGLGRDKELNGRVIARFVIGKEGRVTNVSDHGSSLPDSDVVSCVLQRFYDLKFPAPEGGGIVTVVYPIMLAPSRTKP